MRRRCELVIACVLASGCNALFDLDETILHDAGPEADGGEPPPDRDRDGVADREDSCIASVADYKTDLDTDGVANDSDPCPLDFETADRDGDNVYDECDPLWNVGSDRRRCFMAFTSGVINLSLWQPRGDDGSGWDLISGALWAKQVPATLVAAESFEAPVATSYDLTITFTQQSGAASVTLWLRTTETAAASDVGCEVSGTLNSTRITVKGSSPEVTTTVVASVHGVRRIQATISAAAPAGVPNVRCAVHVGGMFPAMAVSAEVALPPGRVGLSVANVPISASTLLVLERDAAPQL
jgi:hypothetical protein